MALHLVPNSDLGREKQLVAANKIHSLQKGPEVTEEQRIAAKVAERPFRDRVIEREEERWNTPEKVQSTIDAEKEKMRDQLERLDAERIRNALESRQKRGERELKPPEDFVPFLRECGVEEDHLKVLQKACPVGLEKGIPPSLRHFADTCIAQINRFLKSENLFEKRLFIDAVVTDYAGRRREHFLKDQTADLLYRDRYNLPNFYLSAEGTALLRTAARKELGLDQPGQSAQAASFAA